MLDRIPEYPIPKDLENVLDKKGPLSLQSFQPYAKFVEALKKAQRVDIEEEHYLKLLKLALYLEEYQKNEEMEKYKLFKQTITKLARPRVDSHTSLFRIKASGLKMERCGIKPNDFVDVIDVTNGKLYTLRVTHVTRTEILANDDDGCLWNNYKLRKRYDINFRCQNYATRCAHYAVDLMVNRNTVTYLFPDKCKSYLEEKNHYCSTFRAINSNVAKNSEQKQAVLNIINKSSFPAPYILYGPPGTGKTATLIEAICQIRRGSRYSHILVCTPSNTAADEITRRLLNYLPSYTIYRMHSQSRDISTIDRRIQLCSNIVDNAIVLPDHDFMKKRVVITTLCNAIRLIIMKVRCDYFSHVFIDESGQGTEPDMLIPISLVSEHGKLNSQIVFAGDPQQLGPTVISKLAETILGRSILERLMSYEIYQKDCNNKYNPKYITKLLINYRSHPDIIHIPNKLFYDNELIAKYPRSYGKEMFPIIFHGVKGKEHKYPYSNSICNFEERDLVIEYVVNLLKNRLGFGVVRPTDIGIVTPFTLQTNEIQQALNYKRIKGINVGTIELFQGQEQKIMIITTVRTKFFSHGQQKHLGFLSNPKRFNVAVTRAKRLLIVIGDPDILQIDQNWWSFLKFCMFNKSYRGVKFSFRERLEDNCTSSDNENLTSLINDLCIFD